MTSTKRLHLAAALLLATALLGCSEQKKDPAAAVPAMTGAPTLSATAVVEGTQLTLTVPVNSSARRVAVQLGSDQQLTGEYFGAGALTGNEAGEGFISGSITVPTGAIGTRYVHLVVSDSAATTGTLYVADSAVSTTHYAALDLATSAPVSSEIPLAQVTVVRSGPPNVSVAVWAGEGIGVLYVRYSVTNDGGGITAPFTVGLFHDPATAPGVGSSPDAYVEVPSLPAGTSVEGIATLKPPLLTPVVYAYADLFDAIAETDETDNLAAPPARPAFTGAPTVAPASVEAGRELTVTLPVNASARQARCYLGWTSGPTYVGLGTIEGDPAGTGLLTGTFRVPADLSGSLPVSCSVFDEDILAIGGDAFLTFLGADDLVSTTTYAICVDLCVDRSDSGIPITSVSITPSATPNLAMSIDSVTPAGATIEVAYTVRNTGGAAAGPFSVGLFSDPATVPGAGSTPDSSVDVPSLAAGAASSGVATLPGGTMSAVYALADVTGAVAEYDEGDNLARLVPVEAMPVMTGPPVVSPNPVEAGAPFTVTVPVNASARRVVVSIGTEPFSPHEEVGVLTGNSAGEGLISGTVTAPISAIGDSYVRVVVLDEAGVRGTIYVPNAPFTTTTYDSWRIDGSGGADSGIPLTPITIAPSTKPNLVATIDSITPGSGTVDLTVTVRNTGGGAAGPSVLGLFADRSAVPGAGAAPDLTAAVPALPAGETSTVTVTLAATTSVGARADALGAVSELVEEDNLAWWVAPTSPFASGPPVAFPYGSSAASTATVSGVPGTIGLMAVTLDDVFLGFNDDLRPPDLEITLTSPAGTTVALVGGAPLEQGDGFWGTVLADWAAAPLADGRGRFFGSFRPAQPLSTFAGEDPNGEWTLTVRDVGTPNTAAIAGWSLRFW